MSRAALQERKLARAAARLADLTLPQGPDWLIQARQAAAARVLQMGLPDGRDEYWRYTRPDSLRDAELPAPLGGARPDEAGVFAGTQALRIVFVDGVFDAAASDPLEASGVQITRLASVPQGHWSAALYGSLEAAGHDPVPRPLAALNSALASDGVLLHVVGEVAQPVLLDYRRTDAGADVALHHVVRVEPNASVTLIEEGAGGARLSSVLEADVAEGGALHHLRIQGREQSRTGATHLYAALAKQALVKSFTLSMEGALTRNEVVLWLRGDDAVAHVAGASVGANPSFHHDDTVFITHDALNGESRQVFKKVLRGGAKGVFQGKILVQPGAQKADGYQISQSLLLDDEAQFLAKPELEIYADDVACSHGSTTGAIDAQSLFYLRARGVPEAEAVNMLTLAFLAEALDEIEDQALADIVLERLTAWLGEAR